MVHAQGMLDEGPSSQPTGSRGILDSGHGLPRDGGRSIMDSGILGAPLRSWVTGSSGEQRPCMCCLLDQAMPTDSQIAVTRGVLGP